MTFKEEDISALPGFYEQEMLEYELFEVQDFVDNDASYEKTLMAALDTKDPRDISLDELRQLVSQFYQEQTTTTTISNNNGQNLVMNSPPAFSKERNPSITTF
jgi:hypothetical protein